MNGPREHAAMLVVKASHDLINAEIAIQDVRILDTVCFHAQQAVEKGLKALLASRDIEHPHTHDLRLPLDFVTPLFPELSDLADKMVRLIPFAVELRYGGAPDPDLEQATYALATAREMHRRVTATLGLREDGSEGTNGPCAAGDRR